MIEETHLTTAKKDHIIQILVTHEEFLALKEVASDELRSVRGQVKMLVVECIQDWHERQSESNS